MIELIILVVAALIFWAVARPIMAEEKILAEWLEEYQALERGQI